MPDRIVTAAAFDGSCSIAAGITTELARETLDRHQLSPTASAALGRLMTGAALLGTAAKGRERLSVQIQGDGPLRRLVADVRLNGKDEIGVRGYAARPDVELPLNSYGKFDVARAVGEGYLQVTRSFEVGQPYSGVVRLASGEIGDDLATYLADSEQIPSVVALGVLANPSGIKVAGGLIAQVMPGADERTIAGLEARAAALRPVTEQIDAGATPEDLARSLAGDIELHFIGEYGVAFTCTCSRGRVEAALLGLGRDELRKIEAEQPQTEAVCEFCKTSYVLGSEEIATLAARLETKSSARPSAQ